MDKKELAKRWVLSYTEPSLFWIPWKKNKSNDEYFTVTIIPRVDYYDVFDEKIISDATLYDIHNKGMVKEQTEHYGGMQNQVAESNIYIAKDLNGNVVATSKILDYMSVATKQKEETLLGYTVEYYDTNIFGSYNNKRYVVKDISSDDDINVILNNVPNRWYTLFILKTGETYALYKGVLQQVGQYNYKTNKYHFINKDYYITYMIINSSDTGLYADLHPILRLKKGTYIIEQLMSSQSCNIMYPQKINVTGDMILSYKTKLKGFILRAYLKNDETPSFIWESIPYEGNASTESMMVGTFGTFTSTTQAFNISNYSLLVEQKIKTAGTFCKVVSDDQEKELTYGSNSMISFLINSYGQYSYNDMICYPKSFSENFVINTTAKNIGTDPKANNVDYYSNYYAFFKLYRLYPSDPFEINQFPNISDIEETISSLTPEDWLSVDYKHINDYYGVEYDRTNAFAERLSNYTNKQGEFIKGDCFDSTLYASEKSDANIVSSFYKANDVDIEEYRTYSSISCFDITSNNKRIYKNYTTYLSQHTTYADGWDANAISNMTMQMREKMFEEQ